MERYSVKDLLNLKDIIKIIVHSAVILMILNYKVLTMELVWLIKVGVEEIQNVLQVCIKLSISFTNVWMTEYMYVHALDNCKGLIKPNSNTQVLLFGLIKPLQLSKACSYIYSVIHTFVKLMLSLMIRF